MRARHRFPFVLVPPFPPPLLLQALPALLLPHAPLAATVEPAEAVVFGPSRAQTRPVSLRHAAGA